MLITAFLRHKAHGLDAADAKRLVDMEHGLQQGRQKAAAKLDKLRSQRGEDETQLRSATCREHGMKAGSTQFKACFFPLGMPCSSHV